ncbi:tail fiber assembly protein [Pseudomonas entomophila]|uniref:Tail fiber assembly protein n=2 Tax=Pseudomonas entomophila TaxID=312306 RepID=A0ABY9QXH8_9PSED|nr:tail fiber assembly protein [Pseudomonas entomophila]WMW07412.1 tail fiber assembly protein [Pseudomonas entomophila]CAK16856.1 putative phage tail fiber assembly protein [Pseudomonas entomophila L48]
MFDPDMKYYRDEPWDGLAMIHAFKADGSQDDYINEALVPMIEAEVEAYYQKLLTPDPLVVAQAEALRLRAIADTAIAPLQDAVDLDEASEAEVARLKEWRRYRVALNRLPEQPGYPADIDWPLAPA